MITETKMTMPLLKAGLYLRTALLEQIGNSLDKKLLLLIADPGYGKTTLLAQIVARHKLPFVYYAVDKDDAAPMSFMAHIIFGVESRYPGTLPRTKRIMRSGVRDRGYGRSLAASLINELRGKRKEELFLIFDDYHAIAARSKVHEIVDYLVQNLPASMHVIMASRALPRLPTLAKWIACDDAIHITKKELGFSEHDIRSWLHDDARLPASDLRKLVTLTDGWPIGIKHVVDLLKEDAVPLDLAIRRLTETERPIHRYFLEEILDRENAATRRFLSITSLLDEMDPAACAFLTGAKTAGGILHRLYRHSLFVSKLGPETYIYHPLFREFLRMRAGSKATQSALLQRAAEHYQRIGNARAAIRYWMRAGNTDNGLEQVDDLIMRGEGIRLSELDTWLKGVDGDQVDRYPAILIEWGALLRDAGDFERSQTLFLKAERRIPPHRGLLYARLMYERAVTGWRKNDNKGALAAIGKSLRAAARFSNREATSRIYADIYNLAGMLGLNTGELKRSLTYLSIAKAASARFGDRSAVRNIDANIAMYHALQGSVTDAVAAFKDCMGLPADDAAWPEIGLVAYNAVRTALINNDTHWAEQCLLRAEAACQELNDTATAASLLYARALLHVYREEWPQAADHFQKAHTAYCTIGWLTSQCMVLRDWGRMCRYQGEYAAAAGHIEQALELASDAATPLGIGVMLEKAMVLLTGGGSAQAFGIVRDCVRNAKSRHNRMSLFLALLAGADMHAGTGQGRKTATMLKQAFGLSRRYGYAGLLGIELRHRPALLSAARHMPILRTELKNSDLGGRTSLASGKAQGWSVRLFGRLHMETSTGREIPLKWRSRKACALFAYLLMQRDRRCGSDKLMELFWPGENAQCASENLRSTIFRIKDTIRTGLKAAGLQHIAGKDIVMHVQKSYGISPGLEIRLDVDDFGRLRREARRMMESGQQAQGLQACQECIQLYQEQFMADCGDAWCVNLRHDYEIAYLELLETLIKKSNEQLNHPKAGECCRMYLAIDPLNESIHREYWVALLGCNKKQQIQEDLKQLRAQMRRELHTDLSTETMQRYRAIMGIHDA